MPVYFIGDGRGHVKIGFSREPLKRLADLQTASAVPLTLLAICPGGLAREAELHVRFADDRVGGEWFTQTINLKALISVYAERYPIATYLSPDRDKDRDTYEDALHDLVVKSNEIDKEYDSRIEVLEKEIEALEKERDRRLELLDQEFEQRTKGIVPWWRYEEMERRGDFDF